jgi:hypothetical protein
MTSVVATMMLPRTREVPEHIFREGFYMAWSVILTVYGAGPIAG